LPKILNLFSHFLILSSNYSSFIQDFEFYKFKNMGIGDWGLGIGDWGLGPIPNPQSPIPNPQSPIPNKYFENLSILRKISIYF
jgi:hypothetical protein